MTICLGFMIGIIYGLYFTGIALFFCILFIFIIYQILNKNLKRYMSVFFKKSIIITSILSAICGNYYIKFKEYKYEEISRKENVKIEGVIVSNKEEKEYYQVYKIKANLINEKRYTKIYFLLYVLKDKKVTFKYGDKISLEGKYRKPAVQRNYGGFDYSKYLQTKSIYGTIVLDGKFKVLEKKSINWINDLSNSCRNVIVEQFNKILDKEKSSLFVKILIGLESELSEDVKEYFRLSSLSHMLAVSGSHVSYIMLGVTYCFYYFSIGKRTKYAIIIILLIFFMFITNFSPSVVRACIMTILFLGSKIFYRKNDFITSLSICLLFIFIENPYQILDIGLQLSFFGTLRNSLF